MSLVSIYTPRKHQKTRGILMLLGGVERGQLHEMSKDFTIFRKNNREFKLG